MDRALDQGKPARLIDDATEVDARWFEGTQTVLVTAGASAPEHLVDELLDRLRQEFGAVVEARTLVEEDVSFDLPKSARELAVLR